MPKPNHVCSECGLGEPAVGFYQDDGRPRSKCKGCYNASIAVRRKAKAQARQFGTNLAPETMAAIADAYTDADGYVTSDADDERWPNLRAFDTSDVTEDPRASASAARAAAAEAKAAAKAAAEAAAREQRRGSDFDAMRVEDFDEEFDTSISNSPNRALSSQASKEKRQEFNARMGAFATDFRDATASASGGDGTVGENIDGSHAAYIRMLAEQERRFGNRRWARSLSIAEAHEQLSREAIIHVAETYFRDKITPTGYARFESTTDVKRTACILLSDLHLGSELDALDEPLAFKAVQEARRLEHLLRQFVEFKPQYRDTSEALVIINGDIIDGQLMHDFRSGSPLAEQKAIFWNYFAAFIGYVAQCYPAVRVVCQPGNHGRDKVRHPGRATARKWDGHEWEMYYALKMMCSGLRNVSWQIDFRAVSIVDLHGSILGVTHGDTEVKLGHPDGAAKNNAREFDRINSTRLHGVEFDAWVVGHYHTPRYHPGKPRVIYNGALVPPNGHARASGYIGEPCGQFIWEAVAGYPIGDLRFIDVGEAQDNDDRLGTIIRPFRFAAD